MPTLLPTGSAGQMVEIHTVKVRLKVGVKVRIGRNCSQPEGSTQGKKVPVRVNRKIPLLLQHSRMSRHGSWHEG